MGTLSRGGATNLDSFHNDIISEIINLIYPVGSIYTTVSENNPSNFLKGTNWEKVGEGRVLMGADSAHGVGTTIDSGLPDITGQLKGVEGASNKAYTWGFKPGNNGAFRVAQSLGIYNVYNGTYSIPNGSTADFKASYSNSIYGASPIVQPPAFFCYFWKRLS